MRLRKNTHSLWSTAKVIHVLSYAIGGSLEGIIKECKKKGTKIPEDRIIVLLVGMLLGIQYIHSNGTMHKNLKPTNVLLDSAGNIKIGDVGVLQALQASKKYAYSTAGTYVYTSPEALKGEECEPNTDIWSLGCIMHELCCLNVIIFKFIYLTQVPYFADSAYKQIELIAKKPYDSSALPKEYSPKLRALIASMLVPDQKARPTAEKLLGTDFVILYISEMVAKMGTNVITIQYRTKER
eukprot:TRINITY_DN33_c0_g1_i1.p3 TRINITY_DN33_c0_g1~~TRINITY_DN33_c0_g1_i1.p3  ORF type:complete len:239 (+),score=21.10 TRINITY_DN33_c0_g1_i1:921-1637(+)